MTRTLSWRGCAGCNGTLLLDDAQAATARALDSAGAYLLCRTCKARDDAEQGRRSVRTGDRCVLALYQSGPFSDLFVKSVDGDQVTIGILGMAGVPEERMRQILSRWWPAGLWQRRTFTRAELRMK